MADESRSKPPLRKSATAPPLSNQTAARPETRPAPAKAPARPAGGAAPSAKRALPAGEDEPEILAEAAPRVLPPKVVRKKPAAGRQVAAAARAEGVDTTPASEFLVPLVLVIAGLAINGGTSLLYIPEGLEVSLPLWIGFRLAIICVSTVITIGALFLAAAMLDTDFGFFGPACLKVFAITLTQGWLGELIEQTQIPFAEWLITFLATYAMFKYFFGLDDLEAIASMMIVRFVHWAFIMFVFIAAMGFLLGGADLDLEGDGPAAEEIEDPVDPPDEFDEIDGPEMDDGAGAFEPEGARLRNRQHPVRALRQIAVARLRRPELPSRLTG